MIKPSLKELEAMSRLLNDPDTHVLSDWLRATLLALCVTNSSEAEEVNFRWRQGQAQQVDQLLKFFNREFLDKMIVSLKTKQQ